MVKHVVMWRLQPMEAGHPHSAQMESVRQNVRSLQVSVPGLRHIELGHNELRTDDSSDLLLYCEFDNWEALHRYMEHPLHMELRRLIGTMRVERRVIDWEVAE